MSKSKKECNSIVVLARQGDGRGSYHIAGRYRIGAKTMIEAEKMLIEHLKPQHFKIKAYYIEIGKTLPKGMIIKEL